MPPHDQVPPPDPTRADCEHRRDEESQPPGEDDFLYLHIPPGHYEMPPQTLPFDLNVFARLIPGSEIRSMSQAEYRRLVESQKKLREEP